MQFFPRFHNEEDDVVLGVYQRRDQQPPHSKKWLNPWTLMGLGSAVIATTIIIVAMSTSATVKVIHKPDMTSNSVKEFSTSYKSGARKTTYSTLGEDEQKSLFEEFKAEHERQYKDSNEENERYGYFKAFLSKIDERNAAEEAAGGSAKHGVTKFADLSEKEFKLRYLNYIKPTADQVKNRKITKMNKRTKKQMKDSVTSVDWSDIYTTPVKDQGYCGSCWAFSATEQIETDSIRAGYLTTSDKLSPQQIVSCDTVDYGCGGGNTETAYMYVAKAGGLTSDSQYPYTSYWAVTGQCLLDDDTKLVTVDSYYSVSGEDDMETYVLTTGPLSVCLDAESWSSYTSGIVSSCGNYVDHCVQAVGVDTVNKYWKIRNSWGTSWGASGYIYLALGENMCDITYDPTYVSTSSVSSTSSTAKRHEEAKFAAKEMEASTGKVSVPTKTQWLNSM